MYQVFVTQFVWFRGIVIQDFRSTIDLDFVEMAVLLY